jgi:anti-anti-sigma regulatory factor
MGFSTTPITVAEARQAVKKGGVVIEASKLEYFDSAVKWLDDATSAEIKDGGGEIIITLSNTDFVVFRLSN